MKIIVRMPNWIGDAVMASGMLKDIRAFAPQSKIVLLAKPSIAQLFKQEPHIDDIILLEDKKKIIRQIRKERFDYGILLTNSFSSAYLFFRAKVRVRIGYAKDFRSFLLTKSYPYPEKEKEHLIETYQRLLGLIYQKGSAAPQLYLSDSERDSAKKRLEALGIKPTDILIGVNPLAAYGPAKCWLKERFRELSQKLTEHEKIKMVYFGDDFEGVDEIVANLGDRVINLSSKTTLRELLALIEQVDVFLTNDSGPMHIACALNRPVIALFGSTSVKATGPYNDFCVIQKKVDCSPCFKRVCPIDFRCMKRIETNDVYDKLLSKIANQLKDDKKTSLSLCRETNPL